MSENNSPNIKIPTINAITGLRGVAALWVVIFHIWSGMGEPNVSLYGLDTTPFFMGEFGVDIFFVLSGFAVFLPCAYALHYNLQISWKSFYQRRAARLFPAYHLQLAVVFLLFTSGLYTSNISLVDTLKHIFLLQNLPAEASTKIMGVYWTLPVEMNFYLSIPILFFIIKRWGIIFSLISAIFICIAYRYYIFSLYGANEFLWLHINQLIGRLDEFIIGIAAAVFFTKFVNGKNFYKTLKKNDWLGVGIGIILIICCIYYFYFIGGKSSYYSGHISLFLFNTILAASIGILIISLTSEGKLGKALFANPIMLFLGTISYGIYLWHPLVFTLLFDHFPLITHLNFLQKAVTGIWFTIGVASLSYFFVEKPAISFVKRNISKCLFVNKADNY